MSTFDTKLWASGPNTTGIVVPQEVLEGFGRGKRVPVQVTINDSYTYRSTIVSMGGQYLISVSGEHRGGAGISAGDPITVRLELDDAPREVEVPNELAKAMADNGAAQKVWGGLSYSKKRQHALSVEGAKTEETRKRRIAKIIDELGSAT